MSEASVNLEQYADATERAFAFDLEEEQSRFDYLWERGRYERIVSNVCSLAHSALSVGVVVLRCRQDTVVANHWFRKGCHFTQMLPKAVDAATKEKERDSQIDASNFDQPMLTGVLAGMAPKAQELAEILRLGSPAIPIDATDAWQTWAHLIAAVVLDDSKMFRMYKEQYLNLKKPYMFQLYLVYLPLMEAVLNRDNFLVNASLRHCDFAFRARRMDKKLTDSDTLDGALDANDAVIDYVATAVAKSGIERGLRVQIESPFIPKSVLVGES